MSRPRPLALVLQRPRGSSALPRFLWLLASLVLGVWQGTVSSGAAGTPTPPPNPRVYRDRIEPHWSSDASRFWYRNDLPDDTRGFVLVDTAAGEAARKPAFDHAQVAAELSRRLGRTVDPTRLPVDSLEFVPGSTNTSLLLRGLDGAWLWDPSGQTLNPTADEREGDSLPVLANPRPSRRTGPESAILFINRLLVPAELFWVDEGGQRVAYGALKPGETRRQHTFAGHVWVALTNGAVAAVFEAAREPQRALLEGRIPEAPPRGRRGNRSPAGDRSAAPSTVRSPDGGREAFVRDHNLWIRTLPQQVETQLTFDGSPGLSFRRDAQRARLVGMDYDQPDPPATLPEVFWSPDSSRLIALQTHTVPERRVQLLESSPRDQLQPRSSSYPYLKAGDTIPIQHPRVFDAVSGREWTLPDSLFPNPWSLDEFRWAPDGRRFTFLYNQRGHQVMRVLAVDIPTGPDDRTATVTPLVSEECLTFFDYSNKTYLHFLDPTQELLWMSERDGWNHLYLVDARTGRVKNPVTHGPWVVRSVEHLDPATRQIWVRVAGIHPGEDPYHVHLARVNLDGSGFTLLTRGDGTHDIRWAPDRRHFIDTWSRVDQPPVSELRHARDGSLLCRLEEADASEVLRARGRFPERFTAPGRDGSTPMWGILHRPRDFDPARRYPVVENIYAGPHGQHVPKAFRAAWRHQQEIADRGFVVVQVDGMGTNWRHKAFHDVAWRNLGDAGFPDRIAWIRAAAARFPELDLRRVGIYGGSAGGQNALRGLLAHGDFYQAAVADCGCHDNRMDKIWWNEAWMGWPVGPHYAEQSNVTQAHRLTGNLLLVVGELDRNVDPASTLQVVDALVRANKDFDFLMVPGAGHGAAESDYGRRRRADFLVRHLLPNVHPE